MSLDFTAIDFETANQSPASPCQVGMVRVRNFEIVASLELLFRPPYPNDWFSPHNTKVHGLSATSVEKAPEFKAALPEVLDFLGSDPLLAHNAPFDMGVLRESAALVRHPLPSIQYACSLKIARKTYNLESYRLNQVAYAIGHEDFQHHDALADSEACARIVIHAAKRHEAQNLEELLAATKQKLSSLKP
jgi:DNA polymerase III subunit epsilon